MTPKQTRQEFFLVTHEYRELMLSIEGTAIEKEILAFGRVSKISFRD
jgi:hypothetical protein